MKNSIAFRRTGVPGTLSGNTLHVSVVELPSWGILSNGRCDSTLGYATGLLYVTENCDGPCCTQRFLRKCCERFSMNINCSHHACFGPHINPSKCQSHVVFPRVAQSDRGLKGDSEFENDTRSGAQRSLNLPTQLRQPTEVNLTGPNLGPRVNSEGTDSIDHRNSSRTTPSRPVQQAARGGATVPVPDTRRRCPSAPASVEIRSMLTFLDEPTSPCEADVAAEPASSTMEVNYSACLACTSAPATAVDPFEAATTSLATIDRRGQSPAGPLASPSGTGSGARQGRKKDEVGVCRCVSPICP